MTRYKATIEFNDSRTVNELFDFFDKWFNSYDCDLCPRDIGIEVLEHD
jgi:hypothetical protein